MLREDSQGAVLKIRVKPRARRTAIVGVRQDALLIEVTAPPEHDKANDAVVALLAEVCDVPKSRIEILSGRTHREKAIRVYGVTASQCRERLGNLH